MVAIASIAFRYPSARMSNDDHMFLLHGRQLVEFGAWPIRDLLEEGRPLHFIVSAGAQAIFGYRLLGEMVVDLTLLSVAYALTFSLAAQLSRSIAIGLVMAVLAILASPRLYDYPKAVIPVAALWLCFRYLDRPSTRRLAGLGAFTGFAVLYRYDIGVYVGVACVVAIAAKQLEARAFSLRQVAIFGGVLLMCVAPLLVALQLNRGLIGYTDATLRFLRSETARTGNGVPSFAFDLSQGLWRVESPPQAAGLEVGIRWAADVPDDTRGTLEQRFQLSAGKRAEGRTWQYVLRDLSASNIAAILGHPAIEDTNHIDRSAAEVAPPTLRERLRQMPRLSQIELAPGVFTRRNAVAWLYYLFRGLPLLALGMLAARLVQHRTPIQTIETAKVVAVALLCAVAAPLLLRGDLDRSDRLADVACMSVVLGAWLIASARGAWTWRVVSAVALTLTVASLYVVGGVARSVRDAKFFEGSHEFSQELASQRQGLLASPPLETWMSSDTGVRGIVRYLRACTEPDDRVFVTGFHPDVSFFSGRGIAGDRIFVLPGFWNLPEEQRRTIEVMKRTGMALAIVETPVGDPEPTTNGLFGRDLPLVHSYVQANYRMVGRHSFGGSSGVLYNVWADKTRLPAGTFETFDLPCFRDSSAPIY